MLELLTGAAAGGGQPPGALRRCDRCCGVMRRMAAAAGGKQVRQQAAERGLGDGGACPISLLVALVCERALSLPLPGQAGARPARRRILLQEDAGTRSIAAGRGLRPSVPPVTPCPTLLVQDPSNNLLTHRHPSPQVMCPPTRCLTCRAAAAAAATGGVGQGSLPGIPAAQPGCFVLPEATKRASGVDERLLQLCLRPPGALGAAGGGGGGRGRGSRGIA